MPAPNQELTPGQIETLRKLGAAGFTFISFPLTERGIGLRRGNCAGLVLPKPGGGLKLLGEPGYLVEGRIGVAVFRQGKKFYVWKQAAVEATAERERELEDFRRDLRAFLDAPQRSSGAP